MEFWGVEVKPGLTVKCEPGEGKYLHITQVALGDAKNKAVENVPIYLKFNDQKLVIGTLSSDKCAHILSDLVFEKDFELSHSSKNASVYFCGYKSEMDDEEYPDEFSDSEDFEFDKMVDVPNALNGKPKVKVQQEKSAAVKSSADNKDKAVKQKAKAGGPIIAEPKAEDEDPNFGSEDSDDLSDYCPGSDDENIMQAMAGHEDDSDEEDDDDSSDEDDDDSSDEDDDSSDEEDEATPEKSANGKKRQAESASKTPVPEKKAKLATPAGQKTGGNGKKSAHIATPHPAKQAGKTPANNDKSKQQTPKSSSSATCKSCSKSFNSEKALESHTKAKHSAAM